MVVVRPCDVGARPRLKQSVYTDIFAFRQFSLVDDCAAHLNVTLHARYVADGRGEEARLGDHRRVDWKEITVVLFLSFFSSMW